MFRSKLSAAILLVAMGCQQTPEAPEVKARKSALETKAEGLDVKWPSLSPTGFPALALERGDDGFEPAKNQPRPGSSRPAEVKLPVMAGSPFEVRDSDVAIKVKLLGQQPVPGVMKDDLVLFPGAWQGADVTLRAIAAGVEDFVALDGMRPPVAEYEVELEGVDGLRLVSNTLEFLTADGNPWLRMAPPSIVSKKGRLPVTVSVLGCAYDTSGLAPWGRKVTAPGAQHCTVHLQWDAPSDFYPALLDPTWSTTGDLATARYSHALVNLPPQGVSMTCGGYDSTLPTPQPLASCEFFNHVTGRWTTAPPMPRARADFGMAYAPASNPGPRVVVAGGGGPGNGFIEAYDPAGGGWGLGPPFPGREHLTATLLPGDGNIILLIGGQYDGGGCAERGREIFHYRINTNTVTLVNFLGFGRALHQATPLPNGTILITGGLGTCCGGCVGGIQMAELIATNGINTGLAGNMIQAGRLFASTFVIPATGQVRIAGGLQSTVTSQAFQDSELWTPPATWGDYKLFPLGAAQGGGWGAYGTMSNGDLVVAGGGDNSQPSASTNRTFVYDSTGQWRVDGPLAAARRGMPGGARTLGGAVMAVGGADTPATGLVVFSRTELFDLLPNGAPCTGNGLCQSQICVDGVCCNAACGGNCDACNLTGTVGTCTFNPPTTQCRAAGTGLCDVAENCTGSSATCPIDGFAGAGTPCRPAATMCDVAETCPGGTPNCPGDTFAPATVTCRQAAAGGCDVAENCTGSSATCPNDGFRPASFTCRGAATVCDVAENCPGNGAACPNDAFAPATVMCRGDAGICDVAEFCTGSSTVCPSDSVQPATATCRGVAGVCDAPETCDGTTINCPADMFAASTTVCRGSQGSCDLVENCSGSAPTCGNDVLAPQGTVCNTTYLCTGTDAGCPTDCDDDTDCLTGAVCLNGECVIQVTPGNPCTSNNQCTTNFCVDGVCCNSACTEACATCNQAGSVGTCAAEPAGSPGMPSCSPFLCDGTSRICPGSCANNSQCVAGFVCVGGRCVNTLPNGSPCTADAQCASTYCTDGVCCNARCEGGACQACNVPGAVGTCSIAGRGEVGSPSCAPFVCDGTNPDCPTECEDDAACGPPAFCENKRCVDRTRGHVGFSCGGCSSVDGASLVGLLGLATLLRRRRAQGGGR